MRKPRKRAILKVQGYRKKRDLFGFPVYIKEGSPAKLSTAHLLKLRELLEFIGSQPSERRYFEQWSEDYDFVAENKRNSKRVAPLRKLNRRRKQGK
ncbi:hypothetical protein Bp8pC_081 [Bacillus phage Bp8p-C]|uniref:Uncharacterized protein n=2 Tax=Agatevirus Bp8pC TaxID=1910937 RepID=A0A0A0PLJ6_9CAUD|nr:hypothetical protein AXJ20_gp081 [Bacillus phage Bp8p-C]YP_009784382.1 hypothetical protein QLX39_gp081 [Bacillus phage Bp8p-T]AHJ87512.1 hypothetical protein Bp8pC_081 [Bacillus phage Bp8p-C]AHJ87723.1 hypothetical protein Bp8pT_081 [Bacillus phage Bp8p-T]